MLERREVGYHRRRVALEVLVAHSRLAPEREYDLAAVPIGKNAHRIVEGLP